MRQSLALLSAFASATLAADTVSFFYPAGVEGADAVATIKTANPSTTEFSIACPTGVGVSECGWGLGMDYAILSGTRYQASMAYESFAMSFGCDHNVQANEMTCTGAFNGGEYNGMEPQTAVLKGSEVVFNTATIVEGASLLSGGAAASTPTATGASGAANALKPSGTASTAAAQQTGNAVRFGVSGAAMLAGVVGLLVW